MRELQPDEVPDHPFDDFFVLLGVDDCEGSTRHVILFTSFDGYTWWAWCIEDKRFLVITTSRRVEFPITIVT